MGGAHPLISVAMHSQASVVRSILEKGYAHILQGVQGAVRCEERNKIISQRETKTWKDCPIEVIYIPSLLYSSSLQRMPIPFLSGCVSPPLSITNSQSSPKHVHRVGDVIQPSHHLSSPSPPALNPSQHQNLFQ